MNKEVLKQITELIELAAEISSKGRETVNVEYSGSTNMVSLVILNWPEGKANIIYREYCYLNWERDSSFGIDIKFPEFREKLQMMLREKAVC